MYYSIDSSGDEITLYSFGKISHAAKRATFRAFVQRGTRSKPASSATQSNNHISPPTVTNYTEEQTNTDVPQKICLVCVCDENHL